MSNGSEIYIGFSPNNFYYVDAMNRGADFAPDDAVCGNLISSNIACQHHKSSDPSTVLSFNDNSFNCIQQEMCINKKLADSLTSQYNNDGGDVKYMDFQKSYYTYLIKSVNLGIGIIVLLYLMTRTTEKK